jgi:transposase
MDARAFRNATIILLTADGHPERAIAHALGRSGATIDRVRRRYRAEGLTGLIPTEPPVGRRGPRRSTARR